MAPRALEGPFSIEWFPLARAFLIPTAAVLAETFWASNTVRWCANSCFQAAYALQCVASLWAGHLLLQGSREQPKDNPSCQQQFTFVRE